MPKSLLSHWVAAACTAAFAFFIVVPGSPAAESGSWRFKVFLDDKPIGHHHFTLVEKDGRRELISAARFAVKILFVTAYRYVHDSKEVFNDDCLQQIDARTDDNGDALFVKGALDARGFAVSRTTGSEQLASCIMTFAYWNPHMLQQRQLLNAQTGSFDAVTIRKVGEETLTVRGRPQTAEHYLLTGDKLKIALWYSKSGDWLALQSTTEDGRQLQYRLE